MTDRDQWKGQASQEAQKRDAAERERDLAREQAVTEAQLVDKLNNTLVDVNLDLDEARAEAERLREALLWALPWVGKVPLSTFDPEFRERFEAELEEIRVLLKRKDRNA